MEGLEPGSFRYKVLDAAKGFKSSWIDLGQYLFSVYRDKSYREWGYLTFDAYCAKEIGIRQPTAMKLLKSYSFLEREEPSFLKREALDERQPNRIQLRVCQRVEARQGQQRPLSAGLRRYP